MSCDEKVLRDYAQRLADAARGMAEELKRLDYGDIDEPVDFSSVHLAELRILEGREKGWIK